MKPTASSTTSLSTEPIRVGTLAAIRREAKKAGILITDEQIRALILAARTKEEPEFDIEVYKRHF